MITNPNVPAAIATAPAPLPVAIAAPPAPLPVAVATAPTEPAPKAKRERPAGFGPRPPEKAPEFYSKGHEAFFALPPEQRDTFDSTSRRRLAAGLKPTAEAILGLFALGVSPDLFTQTGTRRTAEGASGSRASLLKSSPVGAIVSAKLPEITWAQLAEALDCSVPEARSCLGGETTPKLHVAQAFEATFPGTLAAWAVTPEGAARRAEREAANAKKHQDRKAKSAAT